jgi:uncharacterized membrane protein YgcG
MWRSGIVSLVVVALGVGTMVAPRPAQAMYGDILVMAVGEPTGANAPISALSADSTNVWAPAEDIAATWESVTVMSKLYNPAPGAKVPERSLSLAATVDVIDPNGLLGFDSTPQGTLVLDGKPSVIYSKAVPSKFCHFYWPLRYIKTMPTPGQWVSQLQPYNLTVDVPLDPNHPSYPALLSRVEWSMYALVNTQAKTVDVPFNVTTDWLTLTPGVEIKVEQATAGSATYSYRLSTRYSHSKVLWATSGAAIMLWTQDPTPDVIVTKLDLLDAQGKSLTDGASSSSSTGGSSTSGAGAGGSSGGVTRAGDSGDLITATADPSSDLTTGTASGVGSYSGGGTAAKFRFTLALKPQQQQLRFILENVPVPSF